MMASIRPIGGKAEEFFTKEQLTSIEIALTNELERLSKQVSTESYDLLTNVKERALKRHYLDTDLALKKVWRLIDIIMEEN